MDCGLLFSANGPQGVLRESQHQVRGSPTASSPSSGQLLLARANERRRIARDLHDFTAQHLVAATMLLDGLRSRAANGQDAALFAEVQRALSAATQEIRSLSFLYRGAERPTPVAALRELAEGFGRRARMAVRFDCDLDDEDIPDATVPCLARVIEECLLNSHRHAAGSEVRLSLMRDGGALMLDVEDEMPGLEADAPRHAEGVGLSSMRERIEECGGRCSVIVGSRGAHVVVAVPV